MSEYGEIIKQEYSQKRANAEPVSDEQQKEIAQRVAQKGKEGRSRLKKYYDLVCEWFKRCWTISFDFLKMVYYWIRDKLNIKNDTRAQLQSGMQVAVAIAPNCM